MFLLLLSVIVQLFREYLGGIATDPLPLPETSVTLPSGNEIYHKHKIIIKPDKPS